VVPSGGFVFAQPGGAAFSAGYEDYSTVSVTVTPANSSHAWYMCVKYAPLTTNLGGYGKPLSDLEWSVGGSAFVPVTTGYQVIASAKGKTTVLVTFRMLLSWTNDVPGTYGATLTYAASF
jgi:hypothetical protein